MDQVWNGLEINATDIRRTEEWNRAAEPVTTQRPSKPCPLPEISNNQGDWFCFNDKEIFLEIPFVWGGWLLKRANRVTE